MPQGAAKKKKKKKRQGKMTTSTAGNQTGGKMRKLITDKNINRFNLVKMKTGNKFPEP